MRTSRTAVLFVDPNGAESTAQRILWHGVVTRPLAAIAVHHRHRGHSADDLGRSLAMVLPNGDRVACCQRTASHGVQRLPLRGLLTPPPRRLQGTADADGGCSPSWVGLCGHSRNDPRVVWRSPARCCGLLSPDRSHPPTPPGIPAVLRAVRLSADRITGRCAMPRMRPSPRAEGRCGCTVSHRDPSHPHDRPLYCPRTHGARPRVPGAWCPVPHQAAETHPLNLIRFAPAEGMR